MLGSNVEISRFTHYKTLASNELTVEFMSSLKLNRPSFEIKYEIKDHFVSKNMVSVYHLLIAIWSNATKQIVWIVEYIWKSKSCVKETIISETKKKHILLQYDNIIVYSWPLSKKKNV